MAEDRIAEILTVWGKPHYPPSDLTICFTRANIAKLAEQIACAAMLATDSQGRHISVNGDFAELEEMAADAIAKWLHAAVIVR